MSDETPRAWIEPDTDGERRARALRDRAAATAAKVAVAYRCRQCNRAMSGAVRHTAVGLALVGQLPAAPRDAGLGAYLARLKGRAGARPPYPAERVCVPLEGDFADGQAEAAAVACEHCSRVVDLDLEELRAAAAEHRRTGRQGNLRV